jgi:hypothetical protein
MKWGMHLPLRGDGMPRVGREERHVAAVDEDQYSLGSSSVVTLRSHSVMIQSFRSGVTW